MAPPVKHSRRPKGFSAALRRAFIDACTLELRALKPGNVHDYAAGHGMSVGDFIASAEAAAAPLCRAGRGVGVRIRDAAAATHAAVGCNTNLGIVLLAAPLLAAAERATGGDLRQALRERLAALSVADAVAAYEGIRIASPAGLGHAESQDVSAAPEVTLREAMALAAGRDRIARQYAADYEDVFAIGVAGLAVARRQGLSPEWAASRIYMAFLAAFPDSHVARKYGAAIAEDVRAEAAPLAARLLAADAPERLVPDLLAFDAALKARGINPGTSADLTVASMLAEALEALLRGAAV
ncbi:MAG: triphosphoribosyl-dephospho-CoA synthase [Alphaproteobacteria bacterium]|nr:triphosphoribosyl-dephospho-CoA synthase [Alphaproteobacteria bacterium]